MWAFFLRVDCGRMKNDRRRLRAPPAAVFAGSWEQSMDRFYSDMLARVKTGIRCRWSLWVIEREGSEASVNAVQTALHNEQRRLRRQARQNTDGVAITTTAFAPREINDNRTLIRFILISVHISAGRSSPKTTCKRYVQKRSAWRRCC